MAAKESLRKIRDKVDTPPLMFALYASDLDLAHDMIRLHRELEVDLEGPWGGGGMVWGDGHCSPSWNICSPS